MSAINVDTIRSRTGTAPQLDKGVEITVGYGITGAGGVNITGVATATSFSGDGSGLTGVASTDNIITGTAATFTGSVNISGITTVGIITSYTSVTAGDVVLNASDGTVTATSFSGDGGSLTGLPAGFNWVDGSLF
tara:strand:+ start:137 stop:541 length:405 start_codon:yes stop_codon:yes gene_type:complete